MLRNPLVFTILLCLIWVSGYGQSTDGQLSPADSVNANEKPPPFRTNLHKRLPNTTAYMILPEDMKITANPDGYINARMLVTAFEASTSIDLQMKYFQPEEFTAKGAEVLSVEKNIKIGGYVSGIMRIKGGGMEYQILILGDTSSVLSVTIQYDATDTSYHKEVRKALNYVVWDRSEKVDKLADATFVLDTSKQYLAFLDKTLVGYVFRPNMGNLSDSSFLLTVTQSAALYSQIPRDKLDRQMNRYMLELQSKRLKFEVVKSQYIDIKCGLHAYEAVLEVLNSKNKSVYYIAIIESPQFHYLLTLMIFETAHIESGLFYKILDTFRER